MRAILQRFSILLLLLSVPLFHLHGQDEDDSEGSADTEGFDFSMKPRFSRPSSGAGIALGFNLAGVKPETLDSELGGDLVLTSLDAYIVNKGLLLGGSWTSARLYDAPDNYDAFDFSYAGGLLGYEHSLFYGRMTFRPSILIGTMDVKLIKSRSDLTADTLLNPGGREVLERLWEDDSFVIRPAFGIGWSPIDFFQMRAEVGLLYPTSRGRWEELREPVYSFQFVFGSNR
ncbi:MAG: hypothetical protein AB7H80_06105 [Candidatus Kapaibacterium sp.]